MAADSLRGRRRAQPRSRDRATADRVAGKLPLGARVRTLSGGHRPRRRRLRAVRRGRRALCALLIRRMLLSLAVTTVVLGVVLTGFAQRRRMLGPVDRILGNGFPGAHTWTTETAVFAAFRFLRRPHGWPRTGTGRTDLAGRALRGGGPGRRTPAGAGHVQSPSDRSAGTPLPVRHVAVTGHSDALATLTGCSQLCQPPAATGGPGETPRRPPPAVTPGFPGLPRSFPAPTRLLRPPRGTIGP